MISTKQNLADNLSFKQAGSNVGKDRVLSLLSVMESSVDYPDDSCMSTLLDLSQDTGYSKIIRQSGGMDIILRALHPALLSKSQNSRNYIDYARLERASRVLRNVVHDTRWAPVLPILECLRTYCTHLRLIMAGRQKQMVDVGKFNVTQSVIQLLRFSFDESGRKAVCELGGVIALADLLVCEQTFNGPPVKATDTSLEIRRYSGMTLTNLTFQDANNKTLLCTMPGVLQVINAHIDGSSSTGPLRQVFASVVRNLSWKTDDNVKDALRQANCVGMLMLTAITSPRDNAEEYKHTLKTLLSALWNLSAHSAQNKQAICEIPNALQFLISILSNTTEDRILLVENAGGIIRNVSSHIALHEKHRETVRQFGLFEVLLDHLKSSSLNVVSNSCGTLWNLSARSSKDQARLIELGAVELLQTLCHSKHKMIAMSSQSAVKNLVQSRQGVVSPPGGFPSQPSDSFMQVQQQQPQPFSGMMTNSKISASQKNDSDKLSDLSDLSPPCFSNLKAVPRTAAAVDSREAQKQMDRESTRRLHERVLQSPSRHSGDQSHAESTLLADVDEEDITIHEPSGFQPSVNVLPPQNYQPQHVVNTSNQHPNRHIVNNSSQQIVDDQPRLPTGTYVMDNGKGTSVQATPNLLSRHDSFESLENAEIRSTVDSEYSNVATERCSPSDLPDSPGSPAPPTNGVMTADRSYTPDLSTSQHAPPPQLRADLSQFIAIAKPQPGRRSAGGDSSISSNARKSPGSATKSSIGTSNPALKSFISNAYPSKPASPHGKPPPPPPWTKPIGVTKPFFQSVQPTVPPFQHPPVCLPMQQQNVMTTISSISTSQTSQTTSSGSDVIVDKSLLQQLILGARPAKVMSPRRPIEQAGSPMTSSQSYFLSNRSTTEHVRDASCLNQQQSSSSNCPSGGEHRTNTHCPPGGEHRTNTQYCPPGVARSILVESNHSAGSASTDSYGEGDGAAMEQSTVFLSEDEVIDCTRVTMSTQQPSRLPFFATNQQRVGQQQATNQRSGHQQHGNTSSSASNATTISASGASSTVRID